MNTAKIQNNPVNPSLQKFNKGFKHFMSIDVQPEQVIFILPNSKRVPDAMAEANKRINELCLPLEALAVGRLSNNFIVRPINEQSSFERLSEMMEVCHA
jgi:hypothetical protein